LAHLDHIDKLSKGKAKQMAGGICRKAFIRLTSHGGAAGAFSTTPSA